MKVFKSLIMVIVSVCFVMGMSAVVWAGPPQPGEKPTTKEPFKPVAVYTCPKGWHKQFKQGWKIYCVPDKPKPMDCPEGTVYNESECGVGCIPEIK